MKLIAIHIAKEKLREANWINGMKLLERKKKLKIY